MLSTMKSERNRHQIRCWQRKKGSKLLETSATHFTGTGAGTSFCPIQAHSEIAVSVQVVWSQEHVMISDGKRNQRDNGTRSADGKEKGPNSLPKTGLVFTAQMVDKGAQMSWFMIPCLELR